MEWMLPVEQSDEQRKVTSLQRDLERALSTRPKIVAGFNGLDETTSEMLAIVPVLEPLRQEQIDQLSQDFLSKLPRLSMTPRRGGNSLHYQIDGISESQADRYHNEYSNFENKVRDHYKTSP